MPPSQRTLLTISFSHYCEKARWGLDRSGLPYRERGYLPLMHMLPVAVRTRGAADKKSDSLSTSNSTPVLIEENGLRICDSSRILHHLDERCGLGLFPTKESVELDAYLSTSLGGHTRRFAYHYILSNKSALRSMLLRQKVGAQARVALTFRPAMEALLRKLLRVSESSAARSRDKILHICDEIDARLSDGRVFLCGDDFSGADLSLAALMSPAMLLTREDGCACGYPAPAEVGGDAQRLALELRERPVGEHCLRVYREER